MTIVEILKTAAEKFEMGDTPAAEVLIKEYEEKRRTGYVEPVIHVMGDQFKDTLVNLINTKEELALLQPGRTHEVKVRPVQPVAP